MRTIRGGKGLGDALYVQSVARYLVGKGERLKVATSWPDVFRPLGDKVQFIDFTRQGIDILAHYSMRKSLATRQWQDVCITAKVPVETPLQLDWMPTGDMGAALRRAANGRPILAVQLARNPMGRVDGFGKELLPDCNTIQRTIDQAKDRGAFVILIGSGQALFNFKGIDVSFANRTTVCELFDVACEVDAFLGYVSFIVPLAESLGKPVLCVWSARGLRASHVYVRQITPAKVLEKPTSRAVMDDANDRQLADALNELL